MRRLLFSFIMLFVVYSSFAQQKQVTGTVTNKTSGVPLSGVTVSAEGQLGTTDADGKFSVMGNRGERITFSYVGLKTYLLTVGDNATNLSIKLEEDPQNLEDVVVVGYTTEKKRDLKGAITVVKVGDALKETNANLMTSLQGRVPGLNISTDGAPGSGVTVNLRGLASFNNNTPPLFIIDGVPTYDFNGLSPNDIESLQVLKDAASAAIYGARGSSGVIVITTKRGKTKNAQVTFDAFYGWKTRKKTLDMLNAQEYGQVLWQGFKNDGVSPNDPIYGNGATPNIPAFLDPPNNTTPSANTNWQKEVFQPAANMAYNLGVSKAADKSSFYFGVNYNREDGLAKQTFYDRLTVRMNSSFNINHAITIGENLSLGYLTGNRENEGRVLEASVLQLPIIPLKDNLGNWAGPFASLGDYRNPLGDLTRYKDNVSKGYRVFGNAFTDIEIIKGLTYHGAIAIDLVKSGLKFFNARYVMGRFSSNDNSLSQTENSLTNLTATHTLNYGLRKGLHDLNLLAGYEWIHNNAYSINATARSFFLETKDYQYLGAGTPSGSGGGGEEYGLIGQFGKINYSYNSRYLFSASIRRDGSSRFGPANRYGTFPAVSGAWRINEESFFPTSKSKISDLKLRVSWGQNGNDNIKNYNYATFYAPSIDYANYDIFGLNNVTNWNNATGFAVSSIGNPNTKWEAVEQTNLGIDLGLFNNRLYLTADYYIKKSSDLLYQAQLPAVVGGGTRPFINVGNIKNSGFEMMLSYRSKPQGKFNYNFDFSFSANKNKVLSVGLDGNDIQYPGVHIIKKGLSLDEFYGYINDGIFQSKDEVDAAPAQSGKGVGRLRFRDVNGDKKIDQNDRTTLGSPLPKVQMGLNTNLYYGNFDANLFFDSRFGNKIWDQSLVSLDFLGYTSNHSRDILNAWSPTNTGSKIPSLSNNNANFDKQRSSFFVKDGSFVRLKSAVIGYTLSKNILNKFGMSKLRTFLQAENILTISRFKGYNIEPLDANLGSLGVSSITDYPHTKSITVGLNISF